MAVQRAFSQASVERALDIHARGRWDRHPNGEYVVTTHNLGEITLHNLREAYAYCVGCADSIGELKAKGGRA